jgi:RNA polymerase sigma-B factor
VTDRPSPEAIAELFERYRETKQRKLRNELVEIHIGFAYHVASRFKDRGVTADDLRQIALLGLVKSVDRFDPSNGAAFTSFAGRTIEGEIKRYFRDSTWAVRVPRSAKELHLLVRKANDELSTTLGRSPSVGEVAAHLDVSQDDVVKALGAGAAFRAGPLDVFASGEDAGAHDRSARLAEDDGALASVGDRLLVERLITGLPERQREIVRLRFFEELTQTQIAERVGVSQMHVSRLIRSALASMRELVD